MTFPAPGAYGTEGSKPAQPKESDAVAPSSQQSGINTTATVSLSLFSLFMKWAESFGSPHIESPCVIPTPVASSSKKEGGFIAWFKSLFAKSNSQPPPSKELSASLIVEYSAGTLHEESGEPLTPVPSQERLAESVTVPPSTEVPEDTNVAPKKAIDDLVQCGEDLASQALPDLEEVFYVSQRLTSMLQGRTFILPFSSASKQKALLEKLMKVLHGAQELVDSKKAELNKQMTTVLQAQIQRAQKEQDQGKNASIERLYANLSGKSSSTEVYYKDRNGINLFTATALDKKDQATRMQEIKTLCKQGTPWDQQAHKAAMAVSANVLQGVGNVLEHMKNRLTDSNNCPPNSTTQQTITMHRRQDSTLQVNVVMDWQLDRQGMDYGKGRITCSFTVDVSNPSKPSNVQLGHRLATPPLFSSSIEALEYEAKVSQGLLDFLPEAPSQ